MSETTKKKPVVKLIGSSGNAMSVIASATKAMRRDGWSKSEIDTFVNDATSGDYDHVLQTVMKHCDVH